MNSDNTRAGFRVRVIIVIILLSPVLYRYRSGVVLSLLYYPNDLGFALT